MDQTHICSKCKEEKLWSKFQLYKGKPSGQCRECKTEAMKAKRERDGIPVRKQSKISGDTKLCNRCGEFKHIQEFSKAKRGLGGRAAYCKPCHAEKYRDKNKAVKATANYRERHRERHLASHRIRMFEYKSRKKVTSDGSVTDAVLKELYGTETCFYCGNSTPEDLRTVDHKTPLARNGHHTSSNLVMACWACNCSKRDMTAEEFQLKTKQENNHAY